MISVGARLDLGPRQNLPQSGHGATTTVAFATHDGRILDHALHRAIASSCSTRVQRSPHASTNKLPVVEDIEVLRWFLHGIPEAYSAQSAHPAMYSESPFSVTVLFSATVCPLIRRTISSDFARRCGASDSGHIQF